MKTTTLLCLLLLVTVGCSDSSTPPDTSQNNLGPIIPLEEGNWWAYHVKIYTQSGRIDESEDTITLLSKTTFKGFDAYKVREKSQGSLEYLYFYNGDTLFRADEQSQQQEIYVIYPMTEGQEITLSDDGQNVSALKLDSLKTPLDLGFEKFSSAKYTWLTSGISVNKTIYYFEPGVGRLKQEFYVGDRLTNSYELVGYHVKK